MGSMVSGLFGGSKKADTSAIDQQVALMKQQQEQSKAEADRLKSEAALKADGMRRRRTGMNSLITTSPMGVSDETLG